GASLGAALPVRRYGRCRPRMPCLRIWREEPGADSGGGRADCSGRNWIGRRRSARSEDRSPQTMFPFTRRGSRCPPSRCLAQSRCAGVAVPIADFLYESTTSCHARQGRLDFAASICDIDAMNKSLSVPVDVVATDGVVVTPLASEVARRRTFAIISHPDAGKTTLTEKLLLFGGAINLAGQVKAKRDRRKTRSDWMKIERERGISVVTSVMTFEYEGIVFNLLDTPGHEDFSEDTYRTLTAVDSAVMVIDAAKGIEARTRKLFEVCRLRDIPIITFINKMDRESRDAFDLLDEIEKTLALDTTPMTWPIGR